MRASDFALPMGSWISPLACSRSVIDQAAAVAILQAAIDEQRRTGAWAGQPATTEETP